MPAFPPASAIHSNVPTVLRKVMTAPAASIGGRRFAADSTLQLLDAFLPIYTKRRTVMVNLALIDALAYGAIFIFIMIGILGMCMEMGLKKMGLKG